MNQESGKIKSFTDLDAWKFGHELVLDVYQVTRNFPKEEQFGLISQLRRAAISITSNIAEGFSRNSYREKAQFYSMSLGSLTEIQNQLLVSKDVGYLPVENFETFSQNTIRLNKILNGLIKKSRSIIPDS